MFTRHSVCPGCGQLCNILSSIEVNILGLICSVRSYPKAPPKALSLSNRQQISSSSLNITSGRWCIRKDRIYVYWTSAMELSLTDSKIKLRKSTREFLNLLTWIIALRIALELHLTLWSPSSKCAGEYRCRRVLDRRASVFFSAFRNRLRSGGPIRNVTNLQTALTGGDKSFRKLPKLVHSCLLPVQRILIQRDQRRLKLERCRELHTFAFRWCWKRNHNPRPLHFTTEDTLNEQTLSTSDSAAVISTPKFFHSIKKRYYNTNFRTWNDTALTYGNTYLATPLKKRIRLIQITIKRLRCEYCLLIQQPLCE